jgi:hypothetical protein
LPPVVTQVLHGNAVFWGEKTIDRPSFFVTILTDNNIIPFDAAWQVAEFALAKG